MSCPEPICAAQLPIAPSALGYVRLAVATPCLALADVGRNQAVIAELMRQAVQRGAELLLLPELCLTGYSCGDLFFQQALLDRAEQALLALARLTAELPLALVVGVPLRQHGRLFNCAAFVSGGRVRGLVPKTYLPNTQEFYEQRWFSRASAATEPLLQLADEVVPFGTDLLFQHQRLPACCVAIEICEDGWVASPLSGPQALAGATLLCNPSASPEVLGKADYRRQLVQSQSARCLAVYAYASAGPGESSTDLVFSGHSLVAENGHLLAESERFSFDSQLLCVDVDVELLQQERQRNNSFAAGATAASWRRIPFDVASSPQNALLRVLPAEPFVPAHATERQSRCAEIFALQSTALMRRLRHLGSRQVVIGLSGGLDSTLALLVTLQAFDRLGLPRSGIVGLTLPGFGTSSRTRNNAWRLMELLGVTAREIFIDAAVRQHFADIGHDEALQDITYENAQARERTQILMDVANQVSGIVIGTGDLSELALGWCTYNADHMSMYAVNCGVPKTLVRYLVAWCAEQLFSGEARTVLQDICATPVSPELLPPAADGSIRQKTEDQVGPYVLHDFFLFYLLRYQFAPRKIYALACGAFAGRYDQDEILHWLRVFYRRFFSQQFKRSCLPDGPKIGTVALSPRGDWRMPSDAAVALWLEDLERFDG
ncbi:MAG: NAD(+) synthase [Desulfuromonas thiophila]|nr:NAD(+) synthase [Desulfuromonas thiophila]